MKSLMLNFTTSLHIPRYFTQLELINYLHFVSGGIQLPKKCILRFYIRSNYLISDLTRLLEDALKC